MNSIHHESTYLTMKKTIIATTAMTISRLTMTAAIIPELLLAVKYNSQ